MAVIISLKDKSILSCANWVFRCLYSGMEEVIEKHKMNLVLHLRELIKDLEQGGNGIGLDIDDYLYSKEDLLSFIDIVKKANDQIFETPDTLLYGFLHEGFYRELILANETFEPDPIL